MVSIENIERTDTLKLYNGCYVTSHQYARYIKFESNICSKKFFFKKQAALMAKQMWFESSKNYIIFPKWNFVCRSPFCSECYKLVTIKIKRKHYYQLSLVCWSRSLDAVAFLLAYSKATILQSKREGRSKLLLEENPWLAFSARELSVVVCVT